MIDPGMHDAIPEDEYHADAALSSGIAKLLIDRSPAHAWTAHPTLNPAWQPEVEDKFDIGTSAHRLLLEGDDCIVEGDYKDWRSGEAKAFREDVRALGQVPLLIPQANRVREMVEKARMQMDELYNDLYLFVGGKPEQALWWEDDHGVMCRARIDWLHDDTYAVDDYKTTSASSDPAKWERTMYGMGADVQVAFYLRGLRKTYGLPKDDLEWRFVVQESYPPYALSVVTLAPSAMAVANDKVQKAIDLWALCLEKDFWPAYPTRVASIEIPTWEELRWLDKQQDGVA
jgi:hypothetical protein